MHVVITILQERVFHRDKDYLIRLIIDIELKNAAKDMGQERPLGPNCHLIESYTKLWPTINKDFSEMSDYSIATRRHSKGLNED
jgi:hypothetical protein